MARKALKLLGLPLLQLQVLGRSSKDFEFPVGDSLTVGCRPTLPLEGLKLLYRKPRGIGDLHREIYSWDEEYG